MKWISARRSIRTRHWARASAWPPRSPTAPARTYHRNEKSRNQLLRLLDAGVLLRVGPLRLKAQHATSPVEAAFPVALSHVLDPHVGAGLGGMDEFAFADVDPDMAERALHGV